MHGQDGGVEYVDAVNLFDRGHAYGPSHGVALNHFAQSIALVWGELLGVVEDFVVIVGRQNHGRRIDITGQAPTPGFIHTCLNEAFLVIQRQ